MISFVHKFIRRTYNVKHVFEQLLQEVYNQARLQRASGDIISICFFADVFFFDHGSISHH